MFTLRNYQQECVDLVLAAYRSNPKGSELLVLPTGAGKTVVFSHVIHSLAREYGLNTLIIAHRDELLDQAADKYSQINPTAIIGKVGSGIHQYGGEVTVASVATISRPKHLKQLKAIGYGLIIIDEAHHSAADGYQKVLEALPDAFVLMVTATPDRLDKKDILADGKEPLYQASIIDMIKQGHLSTMKAIAIKTEVSLDNIHTQMGDFNEKELDLAINTPSRNKRVVEAYQEHCPGKRAICFGVTVEHAKALASAFNEAGIPAAMIAGSTPKDERKKFYTQFRSGEIKVLTNVMVLTEGFDEPLVECVIMARPTQSRALYVQCIGRGLRLADGKQFCTILDLTDNCLKHRLMPVNLRKALDFMNLKDEETIEEALAREEEEQAEKEAMVRKLAEKRVKDIHINLLEVLEWRELDNGTYVMEVGRSKHRVALVPKENNQYEVWARLSPEFKGQKWLNAHDLEWAQQFAEKRIRMLHDDPTSKKLLDTEAPWRKQKIDPTSNQVKMLNWFNIPWTNDMTKGEASDLIDAHKEEIARKKAAKAARQAERERSRQAV